MIQTVLIAITSIATIAGTPLKNDGRVVGGQTAPIGAFPFMASLRLGDFPLCGGFIITEFTVVTAAHCVDLEPDDAITIVVGSNKLSEGGTRYQSVQLKMHEKFYPPLGSYDVALVIVGERMRFSDLVQPIPINKDYLRGGVAVTLAGWGMTSFPGETPDFLQFVQFDTIQNEECILRYTSIGWHIRVLPSSLCTLAAEGKGACYGDSGSGLIYNNSAVGIVSWGYPCARGYPDVFASLSFFVDWIDENKV